MTNLLTVQQLAEKLQVSTKTLYNYRAEGLPFIQMPGRNVRYDEQEVIEWLKTRRGNK